MPPQDPEYLDQLLAQQARVRALARLLVRNAAAADGAVRGALLAALRRTAAAPRESEPRADWLAWALNDFMRGPARADARRKRHQEEGPPVVAQPRASEAVLAAERQREFVDAVLSLDEPGRTIVLLRQLEGLKTREIVRRTGLSAAAIEKQHLRGLDQLRDRLEARFGGDGAWAVALLPLSGPRVLPGGLFFGALFGRRAAWALALLAAGPWDFPALGSPVPQPQPCAHFHDGPPRPAPPWAATRPTPTPSP